MCLLSLAALAIGALRRVLLNLSGVLKECRENYSLAALARLREAIFHGDLWLFLNLWAGDSSLDRSIRINSFVVQRLLFG
jgi:hypothetical protein